MHNEYAHKELKGSTHNSTALRFESPTAFIWGSLFLFFQKKNPHICFLVWDPNWEIFKLFLLFMCFFSLLMGACAMTTTNILNDLICSVKFVLSWRFPRAAAFLDNSSPPPPVTNWRSHLETVHILGPKWVYFRPFRTTFSMIVAQIVVFIVISPFPPF